MAAIQDSLEIAVEDSSHTASKGTPTVQPQLQTDRMQYKTLHTSRATNSSLPSNHQESTPLLQGNAQKPIAGCCERVFNGRKFCLCSSKAAVLILVWNFIVCFGFVSFFEPSTSTAFTLYFDGGDGTVLASTYVAGALIYLFYPLAGCLADIRWGRYKTVVNSLCFIFWGFLIGIPLGGLTTVGFVPLFHPWLNNALKITCYFVGAVFGIPTFLVLILVVSSIIAFSANVIQFGLDQLHDAPTDDSVLYVYWYVWTVYVGLFFVKSFNFMTSSALPDTYSHEVFVDAYYPTAIGFALVLLGIALCVHKFKSRWFQLIDSGATNPYKLVFRVIKFAKEHSHPIRRSAFTYCEDELPSRLDLGKEKYGGPFMTEEVENVKVFVGILCVLLTLGPIFLVDVATSNIIFVAYSSQFAESDFDGKFTPLVLDCIPPLVVVITIPLYLCLLRPFIHDYVPGMLKRMGLGMILLLISCVCTLVMGLVKQNETSFDDYDHGTLFSYCQISPFFVFFQYVLSAFWYMLFYIATYEFIFAQSPHSMKGLLIGTFFAIKGIFQLLGVLLLFMPIATSCHFSGTKFPICGFIYYLINIVVALVGIVAFIIVSRRYQYRQRDEPDNIYRYAEEYYANTQDEPNYDYDDYDNLNCETIQK